MQKEDKLWNIKSKWPETRACKGKFYVTKKSCTDGGNPTVTLRGKWQRVFL